MPKLHYQLSYWEQTTFFEQLDVAIIGSGIVGLHAAICLKEQAPNLKIAIFERGPLPIGASTRNAGFACFGSMSELLEDMQDRSEEEVWTLVEQRWKGLQRLRQRLGDQAIAYKEFGAYELFRPEESTLFEQCSAQITSFNKALNRITGHANTFEIRSNKRLEFGFKGIEQLIWNRAEGQIHTGKMMQALLKFAQQIGIHVYSGLPISALASEEDHIILQSEVGWKIKANKVLLATNGFSKQFLPELDVQPARNQVLITAPIPNLKIKGCFHYDHGYYYFRNIDNRILLGGGRNLAPEEETTEVFGFRASIQEALKDLLHQIILPQQEINIEHWWSGILGVGKAKNPIIKWVQPNLAVAVRLGGMGIAIGSLVGEAAANLILFEKGLMEG